MNRHRDKRAAFILVLLLVLAFVLGQARRADADRRDGDVQVGTGPTAEGGLVAGSAADALHD